MGRPEEAAGLLRKGLEPWAIAAVLGITTGSAIDYLYRAVGRRYISVADIVLSISSDFRAAVEKAIDRLNSDYWFTIYRALKSDQVDPDRDHLQLYLHLRGTLVGELYFLITDIEKSLHSLLVALLRSEYSYRYFSDLVKKAEETRAAFPDAMAAIPDLTRAVEIRNRVMHPIPPYSPTDDDFQYVRGARLLVRSALASCSGTVDARTESDIAEKLEAASKAALDRSPFWGRLDEETKRCLTTREAV